MVSDFLILFRLLFVIRSYTYITLKRLKTLINKSRHLDIREYKRNAFKELI